MAARQTTIVARAHHSRSSETWLPHSRTTTPRTARRRPAARRGWLPPSYPLRHAWSPRVRPPTLSRPEAKGRADGGPVPCSRRRSSRRRRPHRPTPEQDVLPSLEVGQQGVVEDPARRAEHGALEVVDEQLTTDREQQAEQHGVGREHRPRSRRPSWGAGAPARRRPGRGPRDQRQQPDRHGVAEGIDGAELLEPVGLEQHDRAGRSPGSGTFSTRVSPACDQSFLDRLDDLVDVEHELVALDGDSPRPLTRQDPGAAPAVPGR